MRGFGTVDCCGTAVKAVAIAATVAVIAAVVAGGHAAPAPAAAAGALAAGMAGAPPPPSSSPLSRTLPSPPSLISQPQLPLPSPSPSPLPLPLPTPSFPLPPDRPRWCDALLAEPAAAGDKGCHPTTEDNCGARAPPRFYGQFGQDAWAYVNHFAALRRPGVFLDVATNDAIHLSNTYVFEACLGWTGVCVEPLVRYHAGIYARRRRCELVPFCLAEKAKGVTFIEARGLSGIESTNKNVNGTAPWQAGVAVAPRRQLNCTTGADVISHSGLSRVDWMSLDVEGGELDVLRGIDWAAVTIDVITLEVEANTTGQGALAFLIARGYKPIYFNPKRSEEVMCIHPNVTLGKPTP